MGNIPHQPILFGNVPAFDAVINKLTALVPSPSPNTVSAMGTLSLQVVPFLTSRFPPPPASPNASVPIPPKLLTSWKKATVDLFDELQPNQLFPIPDLWRVALLDERISKWCTTEDGADMMQHILLKVVSMKASVPRNLLLTTLQLATNCFSTDALGRYVSSSDSDPDALSPRAARTCLLEVALLRNQKADVKVRNAAATLVFNEAVLQRNTPVDNPPLDPSYKDEEWEVKMISAVAEAIKREVESEDAGKHTFLQGVCMRLTTL